MIPDDLPISQNVRQIASQFGIFDCIPCASAIKSFLLEQKVKGKHIFIDTGSQDPLYGRIYDDSIEELIATTGHHEGIILIVNNNEFVVDNIHPDGIPKNVWLQNLYSPWLEDGGQFIIKEIEF